MRDTGLTADDAWAVAEDRPTGYAQQWAIALKNQRRNVMLLQLHYTLMLTQLCVSFWQDRACRLRHIWRQTSTVESAIQTRQQETVWWVVSRTSTAAVSTGPSMTRPANVSCSAITSVHRSRNQESRISMSLETQAVQVRQRRLDDGTKNSSADNQAIDQSINQFSSVQFIL